MGLSNERKSKIISDYQLNGTDTGSPEVQVAILSERIAQLSEHFRAHSKDNHSRQGLLRMVNRRRKMLDYVKRKSADRYLKLIERLGLRK